MLCPRCKKEYSGSIETCPKDGAPLCEPEDLARIGKRLSNYELTEILGLGGMGVVYKGVHLLLDKPVAVKILSSQYSRRRCHPEDILREARAASRIRHPHIVDVTDFGLTDDGAAYFVMEYLSGDPLSRVLARAEGRRLPLVRAARVLRQIAGALGAAHQLGIVHRDLKPENIYLISLEDQHARGRQDEEREDRDFVKVLDFGLAKVLDMEPSSRTKEGVIAGTPVYMSPEHARCDPVDGRADIYSLGVVFYQMVTGRLPFEGKSPLDFLMAHVAAPVMPPNLACPEVDLEISRIILRCLEKNRDDRYQTMEELREDLREYLLGRGREVSVPQALAPVPTGPQQPSPAASGPRGGDSLPTIENPAGGALLQELHRYSDEDKTEPPDSLSAEARARAASFSSARAAAFASGRPLMSSSSGQVATSSSGRVMSSSSGHVATSSSGRVAVSGGSYASEEPTEPPGRALVDFPMSTASIERRVARRRRLLLASILGSVAALLLFGVVLRIARGTGSRAPEPAPRVRIHLQGLPPRALAYVDGELRAERPLILERGEGRHRVRVDAEGFVAEERTVVPSADQWLIFKLAARAARPTPPEPRSQARGPDARVPAKVKPAKVARPPGPRSPGPRHKVARPPEKGDDHRATVKPVVETKPEPPRPEPKAKPKPKAPQPAGKKHDPDWVIDPD